MYLLISAQFYLLAICLQVCQHLPSDLEMLLCVSGTYRKYFVYGALIAAEIWTSPSPIYLLNLAQILGTGPLPTGGSTLSK